MGRVCAPLRAPGVAGCVAGLTALGAGSFAGRGGRYCAGHVSSSYASRSGGSCGILSRVARTLFLDCCASLRLRWRTTTTGASIRQSVAAMLSRRRWWATKARAKWASILRTPCTRRPFMANWTRNSGPPPKPSAIEIEPFSGCIIGRDLPRKKLPVSPHRD